MQRGAVMRRGAVMAVSALILMAVTPVVRGQGVATSRTAASRTAASRAAASRAAATQPAATQPVGGVAAGAAGGAAGGMAGGAGKDLTELSLEDLMNVEVTSVSKKKQSIAMAPAAVYVISHEDIRRSSFSTIPDLLRLAPGVDVGQINSHTWAVGVRGLNSQFTPNLLVLQDGRSLYNPFFGGVYWDTVDYVFDDLDRIEVIRGPGATLWGANAVNGVINITSKDSQETQGWLIQGMGSNADSSVAARYGGRLSEDTTYRVYTKGRYVDGYEYGSGRDADDQMGRGQGGFRVDKRPSAEDLITVQGDVARSHVDAPQDVPTFTAPFSERRTLERNDDTANVLGRWTHTFGDESDFSLQAYADYLSVDNDFSDLDATTGDVDFHHRFKVGPQNEVVWGLGYRYINNTIHDTSYVTSRDGTRGDQLYSAFVQDTFAFVPETWFLTVGSKFEHNSYTGYEIQPSARLLWTPNKQNSVWGAVSRARRTPVRVNEDAVVTVARATTPVAPGVDAPVQVETVGNRHESPEDLVAYEVGYRFEPVKALSMDFSLFYNEYSDLATASPGAPQAGNPIVQPVVFNNSLGGDVWGGEVASTLRVSDQWRLTGSYSLLQANIDGRTNFDTALTSSSEEESAPQQQGQIRSYYDVTRTFQINAGAFYVGEVKGYRVPEYVGVDVNAIWMPKEGLELKAGLRNLFDNRRREYGIEAGQGVESEAPVTVFGEITYHF